MNKILLIFLFALLLCSCSNEDELKPTTSTDNHISHIQSMLNTFYNGVNNSRSAENLEIDCISGKTYQITGDTIIEHISRSEQNDSIFEIETVEFHVGAKKGYAVISDDNRLNQIYYFTQNGSIQDTTFIQPLKEYIDAVPMFALSQIINPQENTSTRGSFEIEQVMTTHWGQGIPFNNYAPECSCSKCSDRGGHKPIGCVTTATAQTIACCKRFKGTYYGNKNIDFDLLTKYPYPITSTKQQLASFFHEVALCCQIKFECDGSGTTFKSAYQYLKDLGYTCEYSEGGIDNNKLVQELSNGTPHMIANANHAWIICAYNSDGTTSSYYCDWGWDGYDNGWSNGNPYTTSSGTQYSKNLKHIYITNY
jgi:hypothetical protein